MHLSAHLIRHIEPLYYMGPHVSIPEHPPQKIYHISVGLALEEHVVPVQQMQTYFLSQMPEMKQLFVFTLPDFCIKVCLTDASKLADKLSRQ